jgi:hypothetical protein
MVNMYSVLLDLLVNSNSHSNFKSKGKINFTAVTLVKVYYFMVLITAVKGFVARTPGRQEREKKINMSAK